MRPRPDWKNNAALNQWNREVNALRVSVRLASGEVVSLPGDTGVSTVRSASWRIGDEVRRGTAALDDAPPLGDCEGRHFSAPARLAEYLPGSVVRVHREDAGRTAYIVEVAENADPIDCTGNILFDTGVAPEFQPTAVVSFDEFNVRRGGATT